MSQNEPVRLFTLATFLQLHPRGGTGHALIKAAEWQETAVWAPGSLHGSCLPSTLLFDPSLQKARLFSQARLWKLPRPHVGQALLEYGNPSHSLLPAGLSWADCSHLSITRSSQHLTPPFECVPRDYCKVAERDPEKDNRGRPQFLGWLHKIVKWRYSHSNSKVLVKNNRFL